MVNRIANAERKKRKIRKIIKPNIEKFLEFKNYSLEYKLKFLLSNLVKAIENDNKIKNLIKAMNNYGFDKTDIDKTDIETEFRKKSVDYKSGDIENIESIVKYTLLCLLEHNDNAIYQLLYKKNIVEPPLKLNKICSSDSNGYKLPISRPFLFFGFSLVKPSLIVDNNAKFIK